MARKKITFFTLSSNSLQDDFLFFDDHISRDERRSFMLFNVIMSRCNLNALFVLTIFFRKVVANIDKIEFTKIAANLICNKIEFRLRPNVIFC